MKPRTISVVARSREGIWLALAGGFIVVGAALLGVAGGFDAASKIPYSYWTSAPVILTYIMFGVAVAAIVCAVRDVPIPPPIGSRTTELPEGPRQGSTEPGQLPGTVEGAKVANTPQAMCRSAEQLAAPLADPARAVAGTAPSSRQVAKADVEDALMRFSDIDDPAFRLQLLKEMGDQLNLGRPFQVAYSAMSRDHVFGIVNATWAYREPILARQALVRAAERLRPDEGATALLRRLF